MIKGMKNPLLAVVARAHARLHTAGRERGDVVGWALIAVMTLLVVGAIWAFLGQELQTLVRDALDEAKNSYRG